MSEEVTSQLLRIAVAHTLRPLGWHSVGTSACDVLADVMGRYMLTVAKTTAAYSCHANRTDPNLTDLHQAFRDLGISIPDLTEFCSGVDLGKFKRAVPKFPCPKPSSHIYQPGGGPGSDASGTNSEEMVSMSRSLMSEEEGCISSYLPPLPSVKVAKEQGTENDVNELSDKEEVMEMGGEPFRVTVVDPDKGLPQLFRTQRLSSDFSEEGDYQNSRNSISYVAAAPATTPVDSTSIRTPVTSPEMGVKGRMPEIVAGGTRVEEQLQRGEAAEVVPAVAIEKERSREGITSSIALKQLQGLKTKPYEKVHILQPPRSPPSATRRPKLPPLRLISPSLVEPTTPIAIAPMQQPPLSPIQRSPGPSWPGRPPGLPILSPIQRSLYRPSVPGTMEVCRRVRPVMQPMLTSPPILSPPNTDLPVVIEHVALPTGSAPIPSPAVHQSVSQSISSTPVPPLYRGALYSQPNPPQPTVAPPAAPALYSQPNPPQPTVAPPTAPALYSQPNPPQPTVAPPAVPALYSQPNPPQPTVVPPTAPALYSQPNPPQPTVAPPAALYSQPNPPQPTVAPPAAPALYGQPNPPQPTVAPPAAPLIVRPEEVVSKTPKQESSALYQSTNEGEERVQSPVVDRDREFYQTSPGEHPRETEREGEKSDGEEEEEEEVGEQSPILSAISSSSDDEVDDEEPPGSLLDQETPPSSPVKPISPPARVEDGSFPLPPTASAHVVGVEALRDEERKRGRARRADVQDAESIVLPVPLDLDKRPLMLSSKSPLTSPSSMSEDVEQAMVDKPASLRKQRSPVDLSSLPGVDDIPVTLESSNELEESDEDSSEWEDMDTEVARDQGTAKAAFVDVAGETKKMEEEEESPQLIVTFHRYLIKSLQTKGGGKESLRALPKPKENLSAAVPSPLPVKLKVEPIFRPTVTLPHLEYPPPPASFVVSMDRNLLSYTKFSLPPLTLPYLRSSPSKERIKTPMASGADSIKRRLASFGVENRFRTSRSPVTMATLLPVLGAAEVPSRKRRLEAEEVEEYGAKKVKVIPQSSSSSSSSSNEDSGSLSCTPSPSPSPSPLPPPTTSQPQTVESEDEEEEEEEGRVGKLKLKLKISKALLKPPVAVKTPTSSARREQSLRRQKKPPKQPSKPIISKLQTRVPKLHTAGTGKVMGTKNKGDRTQGARHSVTPTKQATSHKLSSRKMGSLSVMIKTPMPTAAKHPQLDVCPECSKPDDGTPMIACDFCDKWLHMHCVGIFQAPPETEKWFCPSCTSLKKRAATKSSRRKR